jgi:hypothetical protein
VTCYNQPCKLCEVTYILHYLPQGDESSPRGSWGIYAPALPEVLTPVAEGEILDDTSLAIGNSTPPRGQGRNTVAPVTRRQQSDLRVESVLTQVETVASRKYSQGIQKTLEMAVPTKDLSKWASNDKDIGDEEIEESYTKFTDTIAATNPGK